jgi:hypothetical protein
MYLVYVTAAKTQWKTTEMGITKQQFATLWDLIVKRYFGTTDPKEIEEINRVLEGYSMIKLIRGIATSPSVPNIIRKPVSAINKKKLLKIADSLYPIP